MASAMSRSVARIYARRRQAIERHVPFWLPGDEPGQDAAMPCPPVFEPEKEPGQDAVLSKAGFGQDGTSSNPLKNKPGQDGQDGQDGKTVPKQKREGIANFIAAQAPAQKSAIGDAVPAHGHQFRPVHPVHPVLASNGAVFFGQDGPQAALSVLSKIPPWADDRAWLALWRDGGSPLAAREPTLRAWLAAAPSQPLPRGLPAVELARIARQHGVTVEIETQEAWRSRTGRVAS